MHFQASSPDAETPEICQSSNGPRRTSLINPFQNGAGKVTSGALQGYKNIPGTPEAIQAELEPLVPLVRGFQPFLHNKITREL